MTDTISRIHEVELGNLKMIAEICDDLSLNYFLIGGSLLGAIRHQGFIPWDDDMDIGMVRSDYEQFRKYAPALLRNHPYFLQTPYSDSNYGFSYMKLLNRHTYIEEKNNVNDARKGVFIDIFPIDRIPEDPEAQRKQMARFKTLDSEIIVRAGYGFIENPIRKWRSDIGDSDGSLLELKQERDAVMRTYDSGVSPILKNLASQYSYEKETLTLSQVGHLIDVPFENTTAKIPEDYDTILTRLYGDYMKEPPVKDRTEKHISKLIMDNQTFS